MSTGTKFTGSTICWSTDGTKQRNYESGLFMGVGSCHLNNDPNEIQMKSHLVTKAGWYPGYHGLLYQGNAVLRVQSKKIAVWVRAGACCLLDAGTIPPSPPLSTHVSACSPHPALDLMTAPC